MKSTIVVMTIVLMLIGANLYAAGDLVVTGNLGIGTTTPVAKLDASSTDQVTVKSATTRTTNADMYGYQVNFGDNTLNSTHGWAALQVSGTHNNTGLGSSTVINVADYILDLKGASSAGQTISGLRSQLNTIRGYAGVGKTYNISDVNANLALIVNMGASAGTYNIANYAAYRAVGNFSNGSGVWNVTNFTGLLVESPSTDAGGPTLNFTNTAGIIVDKQTNGSKNMGMWLNGDGAGADVVFGPNKEASIYSSGGELFAKDGAGNVTQFSPHDPVTGEWVFYSKNVNTGRVVKVDMEKLVKAVEKLTGESFMVETLMVGE